jgi:hypothetical protein
MSGKVRVLSERRTIRPIPLEEIGMLGLQPLFAFRDARPKLAVFRRERANYRRTGGGRHINRGREIDGLVSRAGSAGTDCGSIGPASEGRAPWVRRMWMDQPRTCCSGLCEWRCGWAPIAVLSWASIDTLARYTCSTLEVLRVGSCHYYHKWLPALRRGIFLIRDAHLTPYIHAS